MGRRKSSPRRGSRSFNPRRRSNHINGRIQYWPDVADGPQLLGFAGYKAGMTHLFQIEDRKGIPEFGQEVKVAATVLETPPMLICAVRAYRESTEGLKVLSEAWMSEIPQDLNNKLKNSRKPEPALELDAILASKDKISEIRVLAATQPKLSSMEKNTPDLAEIKVGGGNIEQQVGFAKELLGKTVKASEVFKTGEVVDLAGVTRGKGFQGPVKRYGIRILQNKSRKTIRGVAAINPASPRTINPNVPRAGQMGSYHRVEVNKRILLLGSDGERVSPKGGFNRYGLIKSDYILIKGSIQGTPKRMIRIRKAVRKINYPETPPKITYINTEWKKEVIVK